ncbi:hypothetical protein J1N35_004176 [Gossypium stocksii]|uniref:Uncharacterized protein n=1 Tax=Gossypium stocksii TaxID=47602 RepID=A0A9D3WBA3_9ROSI|nr:hypothetical protein J1N35_004176 [Gossypium stocksii]
MSNYLAGIEYLCDCLAGCGLKVFQEEQQSIILNGLPLEYDYVVPIITTSQTPFDLQGIATALLDVEARQNAHLTQVCDRVGHVARRCFYRYDDDADFETPSSRPFQAFSQHAVAQYCYVEPSSSCMVQPFDLQGIATALLDAEAC